MWDSFPPLNPSSVLDMAEGNKRKTASQIPLRRSNYLSNLLILTRAGYLDFVFFNFRILLQRLLDYVCVCVCLSLQLQPGGDQQTSGSKGAFGFQHPVR